MALFAFVAMPLVIAVMFFWFGLREYRNRGKNRVYLVVYVVLPALVFLAYFGTFVVMMLFAE
ncbi:MAG: hypothetical protein ACYSU0_19500 [Planctomycetota bacterium]|jgi:hypothetical protein